MHHAVLRHAALTAATLLISSAFAADQPSVPPSSAKAKAAATAKASATKPGKAVAKATAKTTAKKAPKTAAREPREETGPGELADFRGVQASDEAVQVANWVSYSRNNRGKNFVLIDKKQARMYVFDAKGKLKRDAPVLLGKAIGDHTVPGVGDKPLSQLKEEEKTTPAGRFMASPGRNLQGHDILWIDYKNAVSLHRVLNVRDEQRLERLASPRIDDNRISNGCVNVPVAFYNTVLKPSVGKKGAYVYVLPETRTPQQVFGSLEVPSAAKPAAAPTASASNQAEETKR